MEGDTSQITFKSTNISTGISILESLNHEVVKKGLIKVKS